MSSLTWFLQAAAQETISVMNSIGLNRIQTQAEIKARLSVDLKRDGFMHLFMYLFILRI